MDLANIVVFLLLALVGLAVALAFLGTDLQAARREYLSPGIILPLSENVRLEAKTTSSGGGLHNYDIKITGNFRYTGAIDKNNPKKVVPVVQFKRTSKKMTSAGADFFVLNDEFMSLNLVTEITSPVPPLEYKGKSFNDKLVEFQGIIMDVENGYTTTKGNPERIIVTVEDIKPVSSLERLKEGIFFPPCSAGITLECYNRKSLPETFLPMSECIGTGSLQKCEKFIDFCGMDVHARADEIKCNENEIRLFVDASRRVKEEKQGREKLINFEPAERAELSFWEDSECTRLFDNYADLFQRCPDKRLGGEYEISGLPIAP